MQIACLLSRSHVRTPTSAFGRKPVKKEGVAPQVPDTTVEKPLARHLSILDFRKPCVASCLSPLFAAKFQISEEVGDFAESEYVERALGHHRHRLASADYFVL